MASATHIKCRSCDQVKLATAFSGNQIKKKTRIPTTPGYAASMCIDCSPQQKWEDKCADCDITKPIDEFSKNGRKRDQDDAICKACQELRDKADPGGEGLEGDGRRDESEDSDEFQ